MDFKRKHKNILVLTTLLALSSSSQLLASSYSDDDPQLRDIYNLSNQYAELKDPETSTAKLEGLLSGNAPAVFLSRNGFITFYNICSDLSGNYLTMKNRKEACNALNRILDHEMCNEQMLDSIDKTASQRLTASIRLNIEYSDVGHCFKALSLSSKLTGTNIVKSFYLAYLNNSEVLKNKPDMTRELRDKAYKNNISEISPEEHNSYYRLLLRMPRSNPEDLFADELMYEHGKASLGVVNSKDIHTRLEYLAKSSFQLGFYNDCIEFYEKLSATRNLHEEEKFEFASSHYHLGNKEEAVKILRPLLQSNFLIDLPTLDQCCMLFDCFPDPEDFICSSIINISQRALPERELPKAEEKKAKKGKGKASNKGHYYSQTRFRIIKEFINKRLQQAENDFKKIMNINLDILSKFYSVEKGFETTEELNDIRWIQEEASEIFKTLQSIKPSSLHQAKEARELSDLLKEKASKIICIDACVRDKIKKNMQRQSPKSPSTSSILDSSPAGPSLKKQVIDKHLAKEEKVKTHGTPDDRVVTNVPDRFKDDKKSEKEGGNIVSFIGVSEDIFYENETNIRELPKELFSIARERLQILDQSCSIQDLEKKLPPGADLKKLSGYDSVWQFRINDKYRVRFTLAGDEFKDVRVGDFH